MRSICILLLLAAAACTSSPPPENERTLPPDQIKQYIEMGEQRGRAKEAAEAKIRGRITELSEEIRTIEIDIQYNKQLVEEDNKRLFRRIRTDTVKAWIAEEKRGRARIADIEKEIQDLNSALLNL